MAWMFAASVFCCLAAQDLRKGLKDPPDDARIMMRWWWFGSAVTKPELERELRVMKAAGIGGVEVQPVYPVGWTIRRPAFAIFLIFRMSLSMLCDSRRRRLENSGCESISLWAAVGHTVGRMFRSRRLQAGYATTASLWRRASSGFQCRRWRMARSFWRRSWRMESVSICPGTSAAHKLCWFLFRAAQDSK